MSLSPPERNYSVKKVGGGSNLWGRLYPPIPTVMLTFCDKPRRWPAGNLPAPPRNHSGLPAACAGCLIIAGAIGLLLLLIYLGATLT